MLLPFILAVAAVLPTLACDGDHSGHPHAKRLPPMTALIPPTRELEWGEINFIHTTDSHGWFLGHQKSSPPEPNYSGDMGDFLSFVQHMKQMALDKDVDLLLVDSGDLHDGTGLTDGFPPGGIDGHDAFQFIKKIPYDVMAIGNHELYIYNNTLDMHTNFAPALKGRYLSSNVNITLEKNGQATSVPVGERFAKFKTRKGKRITSLGVMFHFTSNDANTTVQTPGDMIKEPWFAAAIKEEPDLFLLVGHMPVVNDDWPLVFNAIRAVHPTTPILIFGGHTHIRDCTQLDNRSMALESGRYMETVGWLSANLEKSGNLTLSRRYLDANRVTYEFHTHKKNKKFDTEKGKALTQGLLRLADKFDLGFQYGTAPRDLTLNRSPFPSNDSSPYIFGSQAVPVAISVNNTRSNITNYVIVQAGSQRYDIFAGPFTKNDKLTASPFSNGIVYIPEVRLGDAEAVLPVLNGDENATVSSGVVARALEKRRVTEELHHGGARYKNWLEEMDKRNGELRTAGNLTLGYVTQDSCPGVGDDIPHSPIPFYPFPDFVASDPPTGSEITDDSLIDFVFVDFIQNDVIDALNELQSNKTYTISDVKSYSPLLLKDIWGVYAQTAWN
jgi:2',3'-cyclic-nucleotide 2'-phosphodiesterase (5'-nucleotidase family)